MQTKCNTLYTIGLRVSASRHTVSVTYSQKRVKRVLVGAVVSSAEGGCFQSAQAKGSLLYRFIFRDFLDFCGLPILNLGLKKPKGLFLDGFFLLLFIIIFACHVLSGSEVCAV